MTKRSFVSEYLSSLPDGIDSYPDYVQKASILKSVLTLSGIQEAPAGLPDEVTELINHPPPPSVWVTEVHGMSVWLTILDVYCQGDLALFSEFSMKANRHILSQGFYQTLIRIMGPSMSVRAVAAAWGSFHRGIEQKYTRLKEGGQITLTYPPALIPASIAPSYATAMAAAIEVGGAQVKSRGIISYSTTETILHLEW